MYHKVTCRRPMKIQGETSALQVIILPNLSPLYFPVPAAILDSFPHSYEPAPTYLPSCPSCPLQRFCFSASTIYSSPCFISFAHFPLSFFTSASFFHLSFFWLTYPLHLPTIHLHYEVKLQWSFWITSVA